MKKHFIYYLKSFIMLSTIAVLCLVIVNINTQEINYNEELGSGGRRMSNEVIKLLKMDNEDVFVGYYDYPLEYINTCEEKCVDGTRLEIVFLINTYIKNIDRRNAIRQTWGSEVREKYKIRRLFLMGIDYNNDSVLNDTLVENKEHKDIIIGNMHDTYHNNSLKCMMALRWSKQFCNNSIFYIIADDDAYFNIKNLINYLNTYSRDQEINKYPSMFSSSALPKLKFFGGYVYKNAFTKREGQFKLTKKYYPYKSFPPYANGHCMIFSNDVLDIFIEAAKHVKLLWIDDVYFGFLAAWANLNVQQVPNIDTEYPKNIFYPSGGLKVKYFNNIISSHYVPTNDLLKIWKEQMKQDSA